LAQPFNRPLAQTLLRNPISNCKKRKITIERISGKVNGNVKGYTLRNLQPHVRGPPKFGLLLLVLPALLLLVLPALLLLS